MGHLSLSSNSHFLPEKVSNFAGLSHFSPENIFLVKKTPLLPKKLSTRKSLSQEKLSLFFWKRFYLARKSPSLSPNLSHLAEGTFKCFFVC
jgi:hypothetical protein